jgi:protein-S-isoprenylcysteine O-methyltransferase Ste14
MLLFLRSLLWTILFPGFFAVYLPWAVFGLDRAWLDLSGPVPIVGHVLIALGAALLIACIVDFAIIGRGTLSPLDPPQHLVVRGLYRYVRNPMYVGVMTMVTGELLVTLSVPLTIYLLVWFACANLFVIGYEEPTLRRQFSAEYDGYCRQVGRWIPRFRPI